MVGARCRSQLSSYHCGQPMCDLQPECDLEDTKLRQMPRFEFADERSHATDSQLGKPSIGTRAICAERRCAALLVLHQHAQHLREHCLRTPQHLT